MSQQYLKYDTATGNITDASGILVSTLIGFAPVDIDENKQSSVDDMIRLKNSGFTADEIIAIKKAGL